jgi:hypothetical protein
VRALTVHQPWAWAIVHGGKTVENRTQAWGYRGPLAIHAGARVSERGMRSELVQESWRNHGVGDPLEALAIGCLIGVVDMVDVHVAQPEIETDSGSGLWAAACCGSPWAEQAYDEHGGRTRRDVVHLVLENPRPLATPIPATGRLGLWTPDAELLAAIREQVPA